MHLFSQKQRLLCCSLNFPVSAPEKLSTMAGIVVKSPIRRSACHSSRAGEHDTSVKNKTIYAEPEFETALSLGLGKCSLSKTDHQILSLMQNLPRKKSLSTNLENFQLYQPALKLYKAITSERPPSEQPSDEIMLLPDRSIRRKVYQLVFDALYHYEVLQELLVESSFFSRYFHTHSDETLLHLMLFDLQNSKFSLRLKPNDTESVPESVARMADYLWNHRTKLNATLARMRVEGRAQKISQLISDQAARKVYESDKLAPCYARVNPIKVRDTQTQVVNQLLRDDFLQVDSEEGLAKHKRSMYHLEDDLLVFSPDCRGLLDEHELVGNGCLVLQDINSYKFVDGIRKTIEKCSGDIVVTEPNSGVEIAHIATILGYRGTVIVYNTKSTETALIKQNLHSLEIRNVKFIDLPFVCMSHDDILLEDIHIIVCLSTAPPSVAGNKVDYAMHEGDYSRLRALLQPPKRQQKMSEEDKTAFIDALTNALTFNQVEHILLRLNAESDNQRDAETIVRDMVEEYNADAEKNGMKNFVISTTANQEGDDNDSRNEGFSIVIQREPDKPPTPPRRVIDRAIANGVIDGEGISDETVSIVKKKRKRSRPSFGNGTIPMMTISAQQKVVQKKEPTNKKIFRI